MNKNLVIIIPVRLGSRRLKNKNILPVKGLPMFVYAALNAKKSKNKPTIFISSESEKIKKLCDKFNLNFIKRPKKLSSSLAEKQEAIVHGTRYIFRKFNFKPKIVVSLQCNSPEFSSKDFDKALNIFRKKFPKKEKKRINIRWLRQLSKCCFQNYDFQSRFSKNLKYKYNRFFYKLFRHSYKARL